MKNTGDTIQSQKIDDLDTMKKEKQLAHKKTQKKGMLVRENVYYELQHQYELQILHNVQNIDGMEKAETQIKSVNLINIPFNFLSSC